jgi:hypothetical protein
MADIELVVRCESWQHAQRIADHLLSEGLIATVHFLAANSSTVHLFVVSPAANALLIQAELNSQFISASGTLSVIQVEPTSDQALEWVDGQRSRSMQVHEQTMTLLPPVSINA